MNMQEKAQAQKRLQGMSAKSAARGYQIEIRSGAHGNGVALCCGDCGSTNIIPVKLNRD